MYSLAVLLIHGQKSKSPQSPETYVKETRTEGGWRGGNRVIRNANWEATVHLKGRMNTVPAQYGEIIQFFQKK